MGQMFKMRSATTYRRLVLVGILAGILGGIQMLAGQARAQDGNSVESSSVKTDNESANLEGHHHYQSPADRANDALLITEVKSALAADGVADNSPIVVDCDHGNILLIGVMKSAEDVKRAGRIAASAPGVLTVKNKLTWH